MALRSFFVKKYRRIGGIGQLGLIITFIIMTFHFVPANGFLEGVGLIGITVVFYCLYKIYFSTKKVIDTGIFKYTRHPMYIGFFLASVPWIPQLNEMWEILIYFAFIASLFFAGYWQEKEFLAMYGDEAVEYYKRTKRFYFF